ncbi:hypothetical protein FQR65_LT00424 [Abscondita terminalis]|nr:hypothetical protein FQR65_LT00424 [Abscondita terminalis]
MAEESTREETVDELRQRLNEMKRVMAERRLHRGESDGNNTREPKSSVGIIDGNFLSCVFGAALVVIVTVSFYAFYNLYHAVLKKFPSEHTEL